VRAGLGYCCHLAGSKRQTSTHGPRLVSQPQPKDNSLLPTWIVEFPIFGRARTRHEPQAGMKVPRARERDASDPGPGHV